MNAKRYILLLSDSLSSPVNAALREALRSFAKIKLTSEANLWSTLEQQRFEILVVDASCIKSEVTELIREVQNLYAHIKIVYLTASPHWKIAKAVTLAGAEYLEKSQDPKTLHNRFKPLIEALTHPDSDKSLPNEPDDPR